MVSDCDGRFCRLIHPFRMGDSYRGGFGWLGE